MMADSLLLKMAIEIVDFPIKNGDFPWQNVSSPEGSGEKFPYWKFGGSFYSYICMFTRGYRLHLVIHETERCILY